MKKFILALGALLFISNWGCKKNEQSEIALYPNRPAIEAFAKALQADFKSEKAIHRELLELYAKTKTEEFTIIEIADEKAFDRGPNVISQLLAQNPLLEVAFPAFGLRENSTETFEQHLNSIQFWVILDVDPTTVSTLVAYDAFGNQTTVSSTFDEAINYGVVKLDEANDAIVTGATSTVKGKTIPNSIPLFDPERIVGNYKIYNEATLCRAKWKDSPLIAGNIPAVFQDAGQETGCERDVQKKDQCFKVRIGDKAAAKSIEQSWDLPKVEILVTYIFATLVTPPIPPTQQNPAGTPGSFSLDALIFQINHKWRDLQPDTDFGWDMPVFIEKEIKTWKLSTEAQEWKTVWVEQDGGTSATITVSVSPTFKINDKISVGTPVSTGIPIGSKDDLMGEVIIEYCDKAAGDGFDSYLIVSAGDKGGIRFRENLKN